MPLFLIAAVGQSGQLGLGGALPWPRLTTDTIESTLSAAVSKTLHYKELMR